MLTTASSGLISGPDAANQIGCTRPTLSWWKKHGCPYLGGKKLIAVRKPGQREDFFRVRDIDRIEKGFKDARLFCANPPDVLSLGGRDHYSTTKAMEYTHRTKSWLRQNVPHEAIQKCNVTFDYYSKHELDKVNDSDPPGQEPTDPDRVLTPEAEKSSGYSKAELYRLEGEGELNVEYERLTTAAGVQREVATWSKTELAALGIHPRPKLGDPIILPSDGTRLFLREDAEDYCKCSDASFTKWEACESSLRPGEPALRRQLVRVKENGKTHSLIGFNGDDLDAILAGEEHGVRQDAARNRSLFVQRKNAKLRKEIAAWLVELEDTRKLPLRASEAIRIAEDEKMFPYHLLKEVKRTSRIVTKFARDSEPWWCGPRQDAPTTERPARPITARNGKPVAQIDAAHMPPVDKEIDPNQAAAERLFDAFGVRVDWDKKTVQKAGRRADFSRSTVQWHIFYRVALAFPDAPSMEAMWRDYPGEKDHVTRNVNTGFVNNKLLGVGLIIRARKLEPV